MMVLVKLCNNCKCDDSLRAVNDFELQLIRNDHPTGKTETFHLCNPCQEEMIRKLLAVIGHDTKFVARRNYHKGAVDGSGLRRTTITVGK
jgi:hypothetical protein